MRYLTWKLEWVSNILWLIDKNGEHFSYLEIIEVVLIRCNVVNNSYQQNPTVLYTFVPKKSFSQLLDILPENFIFLKTFDSEFF